MRWRVGRKLGRTLYLQRGAKPTDGDIFLGLMETTGLAEAVAEAMNHYATALSQHCICNVGRLRDCPLHGE